MPATPDTAPSSRLTDHLDLGVLAACYPRDVIEDVLADTGANTEHFTHSGNHRNRSAFPQQGGWGFGYPRATGLLRSLAS